MLTLKDTQVSRCTSRSSSVVCAGFRVTRIFIYVYFGIYILILLFLNLWKASARRHATINKLPRFKSISFFSRKAPVPFGPVSVLLVRLLTQASGPSSRGSVILTLMTWQQFPKQTRLLETLMGEEFKDLFFPFKSLENPPLHLYQPLNRLMVPASVSGSSCSLTSLPKSLN